MAPKTAPSVAELHAVLRAASNLECLCLDDVRSEGSVDGLSSLQLAQLQYLHFEPACTDELGKLLALASAPRLCHLSIVILSGTDLDILLRCGDLFRPAQTLTIDGFHFVQDDIRRLYDTMPFVTVLDRSTATREFHTAIEPNGKFRHGLFY
ncbi:hypothetical protein K438DRAFT_1776626 [Mycena galopus ATCC 62051]|nr:hypothetical protein K438DRAFT_1776626 [Mycena galopus ATCC 62051]